MTFEGQESITFNDASKDFALKQIDQFDADFGGTEIF